MSANILDHIKQLQMHCMLLSSIISIQPLMGTVIQRQKVDTKLVKLRTLIQPHTEQES